MATTVIRASSSRLMGSVCLLHIFLAQCAWHNPGAEALRTWTIRAKGNSVQQSFVLSDDIGGGGESNDVKLVYEQGACHLVGENIKNFQKLSVVADGGPVCVGFYENDKCAGVPSATYDVPGTYGASLWMYKMFKACDPAAAGPSPLSSYPTLTIFNHRTAENTNAMKQAVYLQRDGDVQDGLRLSYEYGVCNLVGENIKKYNWLKLDAKQDTRCVAFYSKNNNCDGKPVDTFTSNKNHNVNLSLYGYFWSCKTTPANGSSVYLRRGEFHD